MKRYSKGPWKQGQVLYTPETAKWHPNIVKAAQATEARYVYSNFNEVDLGKSRQMVGSFVRPEDAILASCAPDMLELLEVLAYSSDIAGYIPRPFLLEIKNLISKANGDYLVDSEPGSYETGKSLLI